MNFLKKIIKSQFLIKKNQKSLNKKIYTITSNLKNKKKLENAIKQSDIIYHLAGIADIGEAMKYPIKTF